jgi:hypothetical protein
MAFQTTPVEAHTFENKEELSAWLDDEEKSLSLIPVGGFLDHGKFLEDKYIGDADHGFEFTESGLKKLCQILGFNPALLHLVNEKDLASNILNDICTQEKNIESLSTMNFVVNEKNNQILGLVSNKYVGYSNRAFLGDIDQLLRLDDQALEFAEAYTINTKLYIRFQTEKVAGIVKGLGGQGEDKTLLGYQFRNSMVGDSAATVNFFLLRLVCANGLVLPAGNFNQRAFHSGKRKNFAKRLENIFIKAQALLGEKALYVNELTSIEFNPEKLAKSGANKLVLDVIPNCRSVLQKQYSNIFSDYYFKKLTSEEKDEREALTISLIPKQYAGEHSKKVFNSKYRDNASMFDLINVLTEHANSQPTKQCIAIQEKAGVLADWIVKNKQKFS